MDFALLLLLSVAIFSAVRTSSTIDFQVGVILDLDSPVGRIGMSCLSMASYDFYSAHADYKTRLVLNVRDSNNSVVDAAAAALDLIKDVKVDAIIGPQKSSQANFVMDLGDRAHVPILSFSATSPSLIPRTPYFVQTAQSDANQVQAIASIVKAFQWSQVVIIYEDTEFGHGIMPYLCNALQDVNARVSYRSVFPRSATDDFISKELYKMMTMQTRVFVVHMTQCHGTKLFRKAKELGMMSEGYAWIATSGLMDLFNLVNFDVIEAMQGVLGVKPLIPNSKELQSFAGRWIRMFLQANPDMKPSDTSIFGLWAYDTFHALATAAERVGNSEKNAKMNEDNVNPGEPFCLGVSETGPKLLRALLATRFRGLAGDFNLVNGQLEQTPYQIVNVVGRGEREVGIWTPSGGISRELNLNITSSYSTSKENLRTIIWPGDSTTAPRGWEFPVGSEKLRIGVPQKPGFNEFLKVDRDPQTNATEVSGYYKDIFDSVMASLPYAIRYEYTPYPFFNPDGSIRGSYDDLVYQVSLQDHYDAALGDITITANRSIYADFTLPYAEGGVTCIVPIKYEDVNAVLTFLQPLTKELWLATAAFYISTALAVWILGSRIISSSRDPPGQHAGMFGYFPFFPGEGIQGSLLCLVLVTWAFVASLLNSTYTASLSSRLTVQRLQPTITDVKQLIKNGDYVGCQEGSFLVSFLRKLGFHQSKIKTYKSAEDCNEALVLGSENGGISAYYDVLPHIRMILSQYCGKYMIVGPTYRTDGFAFAFPKGSPAVADISRAIIQLTENGTILEIEQRLSSNSACLGPESTSSPTSVTLRSFLVLFVITGCVTITCLLVSLLIHRCKNRASLQITSDLKAKALSRIHAFYQDLKILSENCKLERK
ncbi:UNVERIFIED_CONTAM: Glutamate receptor 2.8 [Sesamum radiatum]|uniref:Glutamate receptor n=1 Tax=Sesamum radiatum TaxID=300843 RepID=A0AAW2VIB8_SESRA